MALFGSPWEATCPALRSIDTDAIEMVEEEGPRKRSRPSHGWTCLRCNASYAAYRQAAVVTYAGSLQPLCLACKWASPMLWVQGQQHVRAPLVEPHLLAEAMAAAVQSHARAGGFQAGAELTEEVDAQLELRATDELERIKRNPRRPHSGMTRGF